MSGNNQQAVVNDDQQAQDHSKKRELFVQRQILRRTRAVNNRVAVQQAQQQNEKSKYLQRVAAAQSLFQAADRAAQATQGINSAAPARTYYLKMVQEHTAADFDRDPDGALSALNRCMFGANQMLSVKGNLAIKDVKQQQLRAQTAEHKELGAHLDDPKRSNITEGSADLMRKGLPGADKDRAFGSVLTAMKVLEAERKGVRPGVPTSKAQAQKVNEAADTLIRSAQTYLNNSANIDPQPTGKALEELNSRRRACETAIIQARHLSMAVSFDQIPEPTQDAPWDDETQLRATGLRTALAFERGGQQATSLKGAGASDSFWVREKDDAAIGQNIKGQDSGKGERMYIFKPTDGEQSPDRMRDRPGAGAIKEALAFGNARLFGQQTGIDLRVPETGVVSVAQSGLEGGDPKKRPAIGSAQRNVGSDVSEMRETDPTVLARVPKEDVHRIALLDIMSLSCDRHDGNIMIDTSDPNNPRMTPIDHGGSLPSRSDFSTVKGRFGGMNAKMGSVEVVNQLLLVPSAYEPFDPQMQAQLGKLDPDAMEQGMKNQRDAMGKIHPDLNPEEKVGDDSFAMSKRAMMFTKLAAKTLSPAEIQIALAARGEELFDVADNGFDALAQQIITDQAPKKGAYQEFYSITNKQQLKIIEWLDANNWTLADAEGKEDASIFLTRDPVNALKLYKMQQPNPQPPAKVPEPKGTKPDLPDNVPNDNEKQRLAQEIQADFPDFRAPSGDARWKGVAVEWPLIQQLGGKTVYQDVLAATGASSERVTDKILETLQLWQKVNQQRLAGAILPTTSKIPVIDILTRVLMKGALEQRNDQMLQSGNNAGSQITDQAARTSNVQMLVGTLQPWVAKFKDQGVANGFTQQITAALQQAANQDPAGAERALQALIPVVDKARLDYLKPQYERVAVKIEVIADRKIWPDNMRKEGMMASLVKCRENIKDGAPADAVEKYVDDAKTAYRALKAAPDDPNAPAPQQQPPQQQNANEDDDPDDVGTDEQPDDDNDEAFDPDGDAQQDDGDDQQAPPQPLAVFDWHETSAKAATAYAVKEGIFKKKKTGLGENIRSVKKAQKAVAGIKPTTSSRKQREVLKEAYDAYSGFGIFVASRLRGMSRDERWQDYCARAAAEVAARVTETRQRLDQLG